MKSPLNNFLYNKKKISLLKIRLFYVSLAINKNVIIIIVCQLNKTIVVENTKSQSNISAFHFFKYEKQILLPKNKFYHIIILSINWP